MVDSANRVNDTCKWRMQVHCVALTSVYVTFGRAIWWKSANIFLLIVFAHTHSSVAHTNRHTDTLTLSLFLSLSLFFSNYSSDMFSNSAPIQTFFPCPERSLDLCAFSVYNRECVQCSYYSFWFNFFFPFVFCSYIFPNRLVCSKFGKLIETMDSILEQQQQHWILTRREKLIL